MNRPRWTARRSSNCTRRQVVIVIWLIEHVLGRWLLDERETMSGCVGVFGVLQIIEIELSFASNTETVIAIVNLIVQIMELWLYSCKTKDFLFAVDSEVISHLLVRSDTFLHPVLRRDFVTQRTRNFIQTRIAVPWSYLTPQHFKVTPIQGILFNKRESENCLETKKSIYVTDRGIRQWWPETNHDGDVYIDSARLTVPDPYSRYHPNLEFTEFNRLKTEQNWNDQFAKYVAVLGWLFARKWAAMSMGHSW